MSLLSSDCQRFQNGLIDENKVWANNSDSALFKWRYTPLSNDDPGVGIRCFFMHNGDEINVIRRTDTSNPVVQNSEIQSFSLNGKVQPYQDSTDSRIFGFTISRVSGSDPKEYQCTASFESQGVKDSESSRTLSLHIAGNVGMLLFVVFWFLETFTFKMLSQRLI